MLLGKEATYNIRMDPSPRRCGDIAAAFASREDAWQTFVDGHGRHRLVFESKARLLPELHLVGWLRFRHAMANALWPSQHRGLYEFHYIVHGNLHWWVEQQEYVLGPGMILVVRPDELHGAANAVLDPCEHYWMQVDLRSEKNLPGLPIKSAREITQLLGSRAGRCFSGGEPVREAFERLVEEHRHPGPFPTLFARSIFHELLVLICRAHAIEDCGQTPPIAEQGTWRAIQAIRENSVKPPSVAELAAFSGVSENTLRRDFRRKTGLTPLEFVTSVRIEKAKVMLRETDLDVTDIAIRLGFSSSQYFATVFMRITGKTPRDYRKAGDDRISEEPL
ncbi:MAG: AraC family transcriptional regulator [Thermoguttaceae bacterium]